MTNLESTTKTFFDVIISIKKQKKRVNKLISTWEGNVDDAYKIANEISKLKQLKEYLKQLYDEMGEMVNNDITNLV